MVTKIDASSWLKQNLNGNLNSASRTFNEELFPTTTGTSIFGKNKITIADLIPSLQDVGAEFLNMLKEAEQVYVQSGLVNIRGQARETNEYQEYLQPNNQRIKDLAATIVDPEDSSDDKMYKIEQWVHENIEYEYDYKNYGQDEYWAAPTQTLDKGTGDCVAKYEEIWTKNGLKKVGDLELGDFVLSYDFNSKKYCYKPIINIWEKGVLPTYRVYFRNGTWIDTTEDHPFWARRTQKPNPYCKVKLKDIDLTRWWKSKVPCVKKLPYEVKDIEWLNEDLCFVIGHFLAEGDIDGHHVRTSGYDIPNEIVPRLERHDIPYSLTNNNSGVPYLSFLTSKFKKYLRRFKTNSFDIHILDEIFYLPENKLQALIDGHFLGDRHFGVYPRKDNPASINHREKVYSTSSYQLAYDLQRIHLQLGKPIHMWLQEDHKGAGNKPIWRLSYNTHSYFARDFGYEGASEVSIKGYEYIGEIEVRDFEVKDTHTFVSKFGLLGHQCEDQAFLTHSLGLAAGVDPERLRTYGGVVAWQNEAGGLSSGGHAWTAYKKESDEEWSILDTTFFATDKPLDQRLDMDENMKYVDDYFFVNLKNTVDTPYSNGIRNPERHVGYSDPMKGNFLNVYT